MNLYIHRIGAQGKPNPGFLFVVFDGTGSMSTVYDNAVKAYYQSFHGLIKSNRVSAIQFGEAITGLQPFQGSEAGDFNKAFGAVLNTIKSINYKDITICVISDGRENNDIKRLEKQIGEVNTSQLHIQFTSIAVGPKYPLDLFQGFRALFHKNASPSCTNVQQVSENASIQDFSRVFEIILSQVDQQSEVILDKEAKAIIQGEAKKAFTADELIISQYPKIKALYSQVQVQVTNKPEDLDKMIKTSMQQMIADQSKINFKNVSQQAKCIKQTAEVLYKKVDKTGNQNQVTIKLGQIQNDLKICEDLETGQIKLELLSQADQTKLLSSLNPKVQSKEEQLIISQYPNQVQVQVTNKPEDLDEMIKTSMQQMIADQSKINFKNMSQQAKCIKQTAAELYIKIDITGNQNQVTIKLGQIQNDLKLSESSETGQIKIELLSPADQTKLLSSLNPKVQSKEEQQKLISSRQKELISAKIEVPGQMTILSRIADFLDESLEQDPSLPAISIIDNILKSNKKSLSTVKLYIQQNLDWVMEFTELYIKSEE